MFPDNPRPVEFSRLEVSAPAVTDTANTDAAGRNEWDELDSTSPQGHGFMLTTPQLRVIVRDSPFSLAWQKKIGHHWCTVSEDRCTGAYEIGSRTGRVAHHRSRTPDDHFYGLGEKAGNLERTGRVFQMRCLDALGYDASDTDPLYKHVPFVMTKSVACCVGVYYDNLSASAIDLGREIDNYHRSYISWSADRGDIDYWVMFEPTLANLTSDILQLTGDPAFLPRWSLGYSGSTMHYTDAPDASDQLVKFLDLLRTEQIPCDSFQLSSGYTSIGPRRYVFTWNRSKFPNPSATMKEFTDEGLHLSANIKPALLTDHPEYSDAANQGIFINKSETETPALSRFWGGIGGHIDFTSHRAVDWWKSHVTHQILDKGIDSTWNDNNEYELWDEDAACDGFGEPVDLTLIRPVMAQLMSRASWEAQRAFAPENRPFLISRSGSLGIQRYVQTWSGDNSTSWTTLKYNIRMGVGMSMSGLVNYGHDVGGFAGASRPEPELFVRWIQNGVMHPRFTIHSWHDDGTVNEPWMYPEVTGLVRDAIRLRYRLIPQLYTLLYLSAERRQPIVRPTFYADECDPALFTENDDFMLGDDILVASVVEKGQTTRPVQLPATEGGWFEFDTGIHHEGGQKVILDAPLDRLPLLVRAGAGIAMSDLPAPIRTIITTETVAHSPHAIVLYLANGPSESTGFYFDDDGTTDAYRAGSGYWLHWSAESDSTAVRVTWSVEGDFTPPWGEMTFRLRPGDGRTLTVHQI